VPADISASGPKPAPTGSLSVRFRLMQLRCRGMGSPRLPGNGVRICVRLGWRRAGDVSEFKPHILVPPTLPGSVLAQPPLVGAVGNTSDHDQGPWKWRFRWWWLFAALPVVVLLSVKVAVGNHLGRSELERLSVERQARRKARKESRTRTADA
jgi:hypothetical protein